MPTGQVARSVNLSPSILGRIAGSLWVDGGEGRADIGLCVKNAPKAICVPDYATPSQNDQGWVYTDAFVQVLTQYKVLPCISSGLPHLVLVSGNEVAVACLASLLLLLFQATMLLLPVCN